MSSNVKKPKYTYTPLNDVQMYSKVNIYGVIKFLKQPYKTRGSDYCMVLNLIDESCDELQQGLKCLLFAKEEELLPVGQLGDVVRFHRLSIQPFNGRPQGQSCPGFSWLLFNGDATSPLEPAKASSSNYQLTDSDKEQVRRLRDWASGLNYLVERETTFHNVGANCYFDLVCQVVSMAVVDPEVCMLLRVWDGTTTIYNAHTMKKDDCEKLDFDTDILLEEKAAGLLYDVFVYDNHVHSARKNKIKPGSYVKFFNLHACERKNDNQPLITSLEFILHRGLAFGRCITVLSPDSQAVKSLNQRLDRFSLPHLSSDTDFTFMNRSARVASESPQTANGNSNVMVNKPAEIGGEVSDSDESDAIEIKVENVGDETSRTVDENSNPVEGYTVGDRSSVIESETSGRRTAGDSRRELVDGVRDVVVTDQGQGQVSSLPGSGQRCMLQTKTVVLNHPHVKRSAVKEVLNAPCPGRFRVCARVVNYHPVPETPASFLKLYCHACQHLCDVPTSNGKRQKRSESQLAIGSSFNGVPHYLCPQCFSQRNDSSGLDSPPHLSYIFMLRFVLEDDTGRLVANIWRSHAITFFKNIIPVDMVQDREQFSQVCDMLRDICPQPGHQQTTLAMEKGPWIECCLNSYMVNSQKVFQIFDTAIA